MPSSLVSAPTECDTHRFREFDIHDVVYKTVNGCNIPASVLVRKSCRDGRHPVIVRWHGGGLVNGHRLYGQWAAPYILEFARRTDAIMVFPDYRLLPGIESSLDVLDDVTDFFAWLFAGGISGVLDPRISADLDSVLVCGESAGGWLALQSGFLQKDGRIRAIIAQYPMIDMRDEHWSASGTHKYLQGAAFVNPEDLEKYYSEEEKTVSSRVPPGGGEIYLSLVQRGLYSKAFGEDSSLFPLELLDRVSTCSRTMLCTRLTVNYSKAIPCHRCGCCMGPATPSCQRPGASNSQINCSGRRRLPATSPFGTGRITCSTSTQV